MAKISRQLLYLEEREFIRRGPSRDSFGKFLNIKYGFNDPELEKVKSIKEAVAMVNEKHVKKI